MTNDGGEEKNGSNKFNEAWDGWKQAGIFIIPRSTQEEEGATSRQ
jgi:hypothetical protein